MALVRWNPAKELMNVEREFNKLFSSFSNMFGTERNSNEDFENAVWSPLTDVSEHEDKFMLSFDLPGVDKKDVKISYKNGTLSVSGERKESKEDKNSKFHRIERVHGKFYREFTLPVDIQEEKIEANFKDGILNIVLPKSEKAKPKEIEVKVN